VSGSEWWNAAQAGVSGSEWWYAAQAGVSGSEWWNAAQAGVIKCWSTRRRFRLHRFETIVITR